MKRSIILMLLIAAALLFVACQPKEVTSAKVYIQQNNYPDALNQLREAAEMYPDNANVYDLLGQVYGQLDSLEQMDKAFDRALELNPSLEDEIKKWRESKSAVAFNNGLSDSKKENFKEAAEWYRLAIQLDEENINAWKNLGATYYNLDKPNKALDAYSTAFELDPTDVPIALEVAQSHIDNNTPEEAQKAIDILEQAKQQDSENIDIFILQNRAYEIAGNKEKAAEVLLQASEMNPENEAVNFYIAKMYYDQDDFSKAADFFQRYVNVAKNDTSGYFNLAVALTQAERFDDGIRVGKIMIERFPGFADGWDLYAIALVKSDNVEDKAIANVISSVGSGLAKIKEGDADGAIHELQPAIRDAGMKSKLPSIIEQGPGDEETKAKVLEAIK